MRAEEFLAADEQVAFIKFMFDATWEQVKRKRQDELKRQEAKKKAALASKRASVVKRNRTSKSARKSPSLNATGRPQRNNPSEFGR